MPSSFVDLGTSVLISRSDGRIHTATVEKVCERTGEVTVQWVEDDSMKGKNISVEELRELNDIRRTNASSRRQIEKYNAFRPETRDIFPREYHSKLDARPSYIIKRKPQRKHTTSWGSTDCGSYAPSEYSLESGRSIRLQFPRESMTNLPMASKSSFLREERGRAMANRSRPQTMASNVEKLETQKSLRQRLSPSRRHHSPPSPTRKSSRPLTSQKEDQVVSFVRQLDIQRAEKRLQYSNIRADIAFRKSLSKHWDILQKIEAYKNLHEYRSLQQYKPRKSDCKIMVCIRKRPLSAKEIAREEVDVMSVPNTEHIIAHELQRKVDSTTKLKNHPYRFDHVFDESCTNEHVYQQTARLLVDTFFRGGKATCFAYGQTGSGKTYTMGGTANNEMPIGIYGFVVRDVFEMWKGQQLCDQDVYIVASYYEIYGSKIYDLLEKRAQLSIMEDRHGNVRVLKLSEKLVENADQVMKLIQLGNKTRSSGKTSANDNSSRSHAIFQLVFRSQSQSRDVSKLSLIDLAGNERGTDNTSTEKKSRKETGEINKALLVLKECIRAMSLTNTQHLPFRGSKLTHVLRDSFIGSHTKTCMIATVSPGINSLDHSCDTLRYANRVKGLKVKVPSLLEGKSPTDV